MTSTMSLKTVKEQFDDGELDLSMRQLTLVPIRHIALVKNITKLDLSCNQLTTLPDTFAVSLPAVVDMNLARNQLRVLPDDLGRLATLQKLDLFRNELTSLPVSIHRLTKLKWLDVRENKLDGELQKVVGDCLDAPQCARAAIRLRDYMRKVNGQMEKTKAARLSVKPKEPEVTAPNAPRKKDKKKKETTSSETKTSNGAPIMTAKSVAGAVRGKSSSISTSWQLVTTLLTYLLGAGVLLGGLYALAVFSACSSDGYRVVEGRHSKALCADIRAYTDKGVMPDTVGKSLNTYNTALKDAMLKPVRSAVQAAQTHDYEATAKLVQKRMTVAMDGVIQWYRISARPILHTAFGHVRDVAVIVFGLLKALALHIYELLGIAVASASKMYSETSWDSIRYYWQNLK